MCTGTDCEPADVLESYLKSANFAMYFSDTYIDPTLKSEPFVPYARDMFWTTSTQLPKEVQWHVRNNYIKSDYGWFAESFDEIHAPQYSYNNVSVRNNIITLFYPSYSHILINPPNYRISLQFLICSVPCMRTF